VNPYLELMRPNNGILAILGIIVGSIVAEIAFIPVPIILAIIVAFLINGAGNVINDYFDMEIDKINRPKRPIPSGRVKRNAARNFFAILTIVSLILSVFISINFLIMALINSAVSFVYSWKLKKTALIGNLAVSWLAGSTFLAAGLITFSFDALPSQVIILACIAILGTLSREIFKDAEDVAGDKKLGAKTLPIALGIVKSELIASFVAFVAILSLVVPAAFNMFSIFYLVGLLPAIISNIVAIRYMKNPRKAQKLIKISMYFIFLAFLLGTVF
jgi:geranylgeranylglycerol-phosphate geranylgeranyltransferase